MADKRKRRTRRSPNRTATRRPGARTPSRRPSPPEEQQPLIAVLRSALRSDDAIDFWVSAAPLVTIVEDPGELDDRLPEGVDLLQSFIETEVAETTALLHMVAAISGDDQLRARARRELGTRRHPMPAHITGLAEARVSRTTVFSDTVGDNLMAELTLPGEVRVTLAVYVTRVPHLYLKDAFFADQRMERFHDRFAELMAARGVVLDESLSDIAPGQMRGAMEQAVAGIRPDIAKEPEEADQWPMIRPLVDFVLSLLPPALPGYDEQGFLVGQKAEDRIGGSVSVDIVREDGTADPP